LPHCPCSPAYPRMSSLFAKTKKRKCEATASDAPPAAKDVMGEASLKEDAVGAAPVEAPLRIVEGDVGSSSNALGDDAEEESSFASLGLCEWLLRSCEAMGFRAPTPVQQHCIPAILRGKDVLGCAETGSGKTAAFALPILHELSRDPYGIFALVLTPTRELAVQISEQLAALGALMGLRHAVVIGGVSMLRQAQELARRPHVVVATPGRLRDHLQGAQPPQLSGCRYVVLDEADRLLSLGFQSAIRHIIAALPRRRQTLLFSATMTDSLQELERLALGDAVRYDLTKRAAVPATLRQEYLFMPQQVKTCFLVQALRVLARTGILGETPDEDEENNDGGGGGGGSFGRAGGASDVGGGAGSGENGEGLARSVMIFVGSCERCQEVSELLQELGADGVCLHGLLSQKRRLAALGKFKSRQTRLLVATDVASRGLDIPQVDLVINYDMPTAATDYVHRVGRTARAGRRGRAVSLVTQHDVELVHNVERYVGSKLAPCPEVREKDVLPLMNKVAKAARVAKLRLMEQGFEDRAASARERRLAKAVQQTERRKRRER
ncbi:unnamed protein product, partial [Phaeothamnion confervicola]